MKTLGEILREEREAWELIYTETGAYNQNWREFCDQAVASAIWDKAVEECIQECFHDEQLQVWSDEFLSELGLMDHLNPDRSYDDVVDMHRRFQDFLKHTVVSRISSVKRGCHERSAQVDQSVSAPGEPLQSDNHRDAWQPIETAPKDGTIIDMWHSKYGRLHDIWWDDGWVTGAEDKYITHWMPLPQAPQAGLKSAESATPSSPQAEGQHDT